MIGAEIKSRGPRLPGAQVWCIRCGVHPGQFYSYEPFGAVDHCQVSPGGRHDWRNTEGEMVPSGPMVIVNPPRAARRHR